MQSRIIFLAAVLGLCPGLVCGVNDTPIGRLAVNDHLRAACYYLTDAEIESMIQLAEMDRQAGWPYETEIALGLGVCEGESQCIVCGSAIIAQVYGQ